MRSEHDTKPVRATPARHGPSPRIASQLARFGLHVAQVCAVILGYLMGRVPTRELVPGVCGLASVAMVAVMLPRFGMYASDAGRHGHGQ